MQPAGRLGRAGHEAGWSKATARQRGALMGRAAPRPHVACATAWASLLGSQALLLASPVAVRGGQGHAELLTTEPRYLRTRSGYSLTASLMLQKMTPACREGPQQHGGALVAWESLPNTRSAPQTMLRSGASVAETQDPKAQSLQGAVPLRVVFTQCTSHRRLPHTLLPL